MKVSIILITYNQQQFIKQAIESILFQRFSGEIEIIIADDCSTDATLSIIKTYEKETPYHFTYLKNHSNLGITKNYQRAFAACSGDYIAILEGDDYWCNPMKIKILTDFLDLHRECVMIMNSYITYSENLQKYFVNQNERTEYLQYVTFHNMLQSNMLGNLSSCVVRKNTFDKVSYKLFNIDNEIVDDWLLGLSISQFGLIAIIKDVMTIYRVHENGYWSKLSMDKHYENFMRRIQIYDKHFNYQYSKEFENHYKRIRLALKEEKIKQNWPLIIIHFRDMIVNTMKLVLELPFYFITPKMTYYIKQKLKKSINRTSCYKR